MTKTDQTAYVSQRELEELLEYSSSLPTGTTIGKVWKRKIFDQQSGRFTGRYRLGEYVPETVEPWKSKGYVGIQWRDVVIGEPADSLDFQI